MCRANYLDCQLSHRDFPNLQLLKLSPERGNSRFPEWMVSSISAGLRDSNGPTAQSMGLLPDDDKETHELITTRDLTLQMFYYATICAEKFNEITPDYVSDPEVIFQEELKLKVIWDKDGIRIEGCPDLRDQPWWTSLVQGAPFPGTDSLSPVRVQLMLIADWEDGSTRYWDRECGTSYIRAL